jgi:hypothetical protein
VKPFGKQIKLKHGKAKVEVFENFGIQGREIWETLIAKTKGVTWVMKRLACWVYRGRGGGIGQLIWDLKILSYKRETWETLIAEEKGANCHSLEIT